MLKQDMKKVYDVVEIQEILGIGRSKVYEFLEKVFKEQKSFLVIKIGKLYKVPKESFDKWISGEPNQM